jgi:hypothetical protein
MENPLPRLGKVPGLLGVSVLLRQSSGNPGSLHQHCFNCFDFSMNSITSAAKYLNRGYPGEGRDLLANTLNS